MDTLWQDLKYGLRSLVRSPGFTIVAVLTLALGIGANTAIFSVVNAVLLRPLPVENPSQLVRLFVTTSSGARYASISYPDYVDIREKNSVFTDVAAYSRISLSLTRGSQAEVIRGEIVSGNYFFLLGIHPVLGRGFLPEEDRIPDAHPVVVIGESLWRQRFQSDPGLIGKTITLNGHPFIVVGVAPAGFEGMEIGVTPDAWVPLMMQADVRLPSASSLRAESGADLLHSRNAGWLHVVGRLKHGVKPETAQAAMSTLAQQLEKEYPQSNGESSLRVVPVRGGLDASDREDVAPVAGLLLFVVGLVLLIACANVANLLLARASLRHREIGVRLTLGASRRRVIRLLLTESLLLSLLSGAFALLIAMWTTDLLSAARPSLPFPIHLDLPLDIRVLGYTLALSLLTALLFGLAPALHATRRELVAVLREEASLRRHSRSLLRNGLLVGQVALSLVLLISSGLFLRSLANAQSISPGFDPRNVIAMDLDLDLRGYSESQGRAFYSQLLDRVNALPGVRSASLARTIPLGFSSRMMGVYPEGVEGAARNVGAPSRVLVGDSVVAPGYFKTMGIPVLSGHDFTPLDRPDSAPVAIINETMAQQFWPNGDAVGKRISYSPAKGPYAEIIGVVADGKYRTVGESPSPYVFVSLLQEHEFRATLLVRGENDPATIVPSVRREVQALDRDLPVYAIRTMTEVVNTSLWPARIGATLLGSFGLLALTLAAVGVYGVVSYSVAQRTREIGIRMALGAQPGRVLNLVVKQGMRLILFGVGIGLAIALPVMRLSAGLLYGVSPLDPATFLGVAGLLALVGFAASALPARRATRVDPIVALRYE
jgi:putative ABC transport system permease protein